MYNEDLKERFIASVTDSESTANAYRLIFRVSEPYEQDAGLDLCQMSERIGMPVANKLVGVSGTSVDKRLRLAKAYVKWCLENEIPGAIPDFLGTSPDLYAGITRRMVSGPIMFEEYLNSVFDRPEEKSVHNVYRLYLWLGFIGVPWEEAADLTGGNVNLTHRTVASEGSTYDIPDEALPVFRNCIELTGFDVKYRYTTRTKPRSTGTRILRGMSDDFSINRLSIKISTMETRAEKSGRTTKHIMYEHAWLSGLFYRTLNAELAGIEPDFREQAECLVRKETERNEDITDKWEPQRISSRDLSLKRDYERWKLAFFV